MSVLAELNFNGPVRLYLEDEDGPALWAAVFETLAHDFESLYSGGAKGYEIYYQIGACSHWLRPHQTRLTIGGGFAYPGGYGGNDYFGDGLPEFDWYSIIRRDPKEGRWEQVEKFSGKRKLVCRVAVPARTRRHKQAAIDARWSPGTPDNPEKKFPPP